jgi:hypothetical protein
MSNEDRDDPQPRRLLYQMQERLETVRRRVRREQALSNVSENAHLQLAEAIVEYHDMLYKYRREGAVAETFPEIPDIRERMGETAYIMVEAAGDTDNKKPDERPALLELSTQRLLDAARELEDVSLTLGFAPSPSPEIKGGSTLPNPNRIQADSPKDVGSGGEAQKASAFENSHFFRSLYKDVEGDRGGGAIVIVDAEDARTGVGKTGAACGMAEFVAWYFGYELQERDGVLSGQEYLDLFKQHPNEEQVSVAVWDEAVGAGSGDARRSMAQENVDLGRAWQIMRDRRVITFVTLPDWGDLDSRLQKLADYRVWCRRDIGSLQAYEIGTTFEGGDIRTRGLGPGDGAEPISFPDVTDDSALYQAIKAKKDKVQESDSLDAGELLEQEIDETQDEQSADVHKIADEVADSVEDYISINPTNENSQTRKWVKYESLPPPPPPIHVT